MRSGRVKCFTGEAPKPRPAPLAIELAFAHKIRQAIDKGEIRDQAEVATRLGLTQSRVTQLLDLTRLAPDVQERILFVETVDGAEPVSERALRPVVRASSWAEQRALFESARG